MPAAQVFRHLATAVYLLLLLRRGSERLGTPHMHGRMVCAVIPWLIVVSFADPSGFVAAISLPISARCHARRGHRRRNNPSILLRIDHTQPPPHSSDLVSGYAID
jgi:hypothetical protein